MVVLQLGPFPPPHGGVQTNLVAIREHLRRHGIRTPVINLTRHRRPEADEVYYPENAVQVLALLLKIPADIVHLHIGGSLTGRLLALCLMCSAIPRRRVVLTFHSGGYPSHAAAQDASRRSLRGFVFRRLDAVIAVNEEIAELFARLGVSAERIHQICPYSPVTVQEGAVLPDPVRAFSRTHSPLMTTVGLLEPEYDLSLQIRTLAAVREHLPGAGLVIVGSGSLESVLRQEIAQSPARDHLLLTGDLPHAATVRLLSLSDLFLRTTLYDGDSVSVREALQLGVPVIASDNGMRPPGVHLIPPSDEGALFQAIRTLLLRGERGRPAGNVDSGLDRVLDLYRGLLGSTAGAARRAPAT